MDFIELVTGRLLPGAAGGLAWFLVGLRFGRIRNDMYIRKGSLEIAGGMIVGTFVVMPFIPLPQYTVAFLLGAAWSEVIQRTRKAVTARALMHLRENSARESGGEA